MTPAIKAVLEDLLAVHELSQVTPVRLQGWQSAARELIAADTSSAAAKSVTANTWAEGKREKASDA